MKTESGSIIREWGWEEGRAEGRELVFTLLDNLEALLGRTLVAAERGRIRAHTAPLSFDERRILSADPTPLLTLLRDA